MNDLRKYLSKEQKNEPYKNERGYYWISVKDSILKNIEEILAIFEEFYESLIK